MRTDAQATRRVNGHPLRSQRPAQLQHPRRVCPTAIHLRHSQAIVTVSPDGYGVESVGSDVNADPDRARRVRR